MKCRHCGAVNTGQRESCWLCGQTLAAGDGAAAESVKPPVRINPNRKFAGSFTLGSLFLAITLIAICLGIIAMAPGLGIVLAIISLPAFVRTGLVVQRRAALGKSVTPAQKVWWFLGSLLTSTVVAVVVLVASVGTFCAVCLGLVAVTTPKQDWTGAWIIAIVAAVVATSLAVWGMTKWMRYRWRRDVQQS